MNTRAPAFDPDACAAKIARLASVLAELCEDYGLDVPADCDAAIPMLASVDAPIDPPELPELLEDALRSNEERWCLLIPIASVVRALDGSVDRDAVHRELLEAYQRGEVELRPAAPRELAPEDAALCPSGPRGSVLAYARRLLRATGKPTLERTGASGEAA